MSHAQNSQTDLVVPAATNKTAGCPERLLQTDTCDLQQVSNGVMCVSNLGQIDLIFVVAGVKINGA